MISAEEKIWNTITDSAKTKFDYAALEESISDAADGFLFQIIMGLAFGEDKETTVTKVHNQLLMLGLIVQEKEVLDFMDEHAPLFGAEILASKIAGDMLNKGSDPMMVYGAVRQLL